MRVVLLSDVHSEFEGLVVPEGDMVVVAGDLTKRGTIREVLDFDAWLTALPHRHKVIIAGNHDFLFEKDPDLARTLVSDGVHYLQDQLVVIEGLRIYGTPWQPRFFDWAFNLDRGAPLRAKWDRIPPDLDLLITHGPPMGILDVTSRGERVGCEDLREAVFRVRPRVNVFGHIHESYGEEVIDGIRFVNASTCTARYEPTNPPIVVDL